MMCIDGLCVCVFIHLTVVVVVVCACMRVCVYVKLLFKNTKGCGSSGNSSGMRTEEKGKEGMQKKMGNNLAAQGFLGKCYRPAEISRTSALHICSKNRI